MTKEDLKAWAERAKVGATGLFFSTRSEDVGDAVLRLLAHE